MLRINTSDHLVGLGRRRDTGGGPRYGKLLARNGNWLVGRPVVDDDDNKEVRIYSWSLGYFEWGGATFLSQLKIAYSVNLINNAMAPLRGRTLFLFSFHFLVMN